MDQLGNRVIMIWTLVDKNGLNFGVHLIKIFKFCQIWVQRLDFAIFGGQYQIKPNLYQ